MSQQQQQQQQQYQRGRMDCGDCLTCGTDTCPTSIIFAGFVAFYIFSFLWDVFVIRGGFLALSISQMPACVDRAGFDAMSPALILSLLFIACFHAISLVWIIGFVHSKQLTNDCLGAEIVDVPSEWPKICNMRCEMAICLPFTCFDALMVAQFALSLYVYLFLQQLIEEEPENFVEKFCIGFEETEEAFEWMQFSLFFFTGTVLMGLVYCCLIRVATNDVSILQHGRQQIRFDSPRFSDQQDRQQNVPLNPQQNQNQNRSRSRSPNQRNQSLSP